MALGQSESDPGSAEDRQQHEAAAPDHLHQQQVAEWARLNAQHVDVQTQVAHCAQDEEDHLRPVIQPPIRGRNESPQHQVGGESNPDPPKLRERRSPDRS